MSEMASPDNFRKALVVFEQHAPDLLDVDLTVKGKPMLAQLLALLSLGEAYDNPNALTLMADKLPAMLVFYGVMLMESEERLSSIEEEIELFVQSKWQATLYGLIQDLDALRDQDGKKIPASLKAAPTKDGIRATIINENKKEWDELNSRRSMAVRTTKTLSNIYKGMEQRIRLLNSQLQVTNGMVRRGIQNT